jgi:DNA-directed RNA polymerase subunit RPC12/RpoP
MSNINLEDAKINYEGQWVSAEDLTGMIQEKMQSGDMKIAGLAATLEKLNTALENSHIMEMRLVLSSEDYERLKTLGGEDDRESIRKAVFCFIGGPNAPAAAAATIIKCPKCKSPVRVDRDERPVEVECPSCGTGGMLTPENKWAKPA